MVVLPAIVVLPAVVVLEAVLLVVAPVSVLHIPPEPPLSPSTLDPDATHAALETIEIVKRDRR